MHSEVPVSKPQDLDSPEDPFASKDRTSTLLLALIGLSMGMVGVLALACVYWTLKRILRKSLTPLVATVALHLTHPLWIGICGLLLHSSGRDAQAAQTAVGVAMIMFALTTPLLLWLMASPGVGPAIALTIYQGILILDKMMTVLDPAAAQLQGGVANFVPHLALHFASLGTLWYGVSIYRRTSTSGGSAAI